LILSTCWNLTIWDETRVTLSLFGIDGTVACSFVYGIIDHERERDNVT
jgi:hypothetical protein